MKTLTVALLVALGTAFLFVSGVQAGPASVSIDTTGCVLLDGNGSFVFTTDTIVVATNNAKGNATFRCRASVTPATSGHAQIWHFDNTSFLCDTTTGGLTFSWQETVSASGQATLVCHINPGNP